MRLPSASARAAVTCAHARCAVEHMCATVRSSELWCALPQCSMFERTADSARKNARSGPRAGDGEARPRARAAPAGAPPHPSGGGARVVTGSARAAQTLCHASAPTWCAATLGHPDVFCNVVARRPRGVATLQLCAHAAHLCTPPSSRSCARRLPPGLRVPERHGRHVLGRALVRGSRGVLARHALGGHASLPFFVQPLRPVKHGLLLNAASTGSISRRMVECF